MAMPMEQQYLLSDGVVVVVYSILQYGNTIGTIRMSAYRYGNIDKYCHIDQYCIEQRVVESLQPVQTC
jgi:hypothetical protein